MRKFLKWELVRNDFGHPEKRVRFIVQQEDGIILDVAECHLDEDPIGECGSDLYANYTDAVFMEDTGEISPREHIHLTLQSQYDAEWFELNKEFKSAERFKKLSEVFEVINHPGFKDWYEGSYLPWASPGEYGSSDEESTAEDLIKELAKVVE